MINSRVLELLKNPKNIQSEDLLLLKKEINDYPYIQNIRALHLYGVHLHDQESYKKELSVTAAYTTDKKILYQLINGKIQQAKEEDIQPQPQVAEIAVENLEEKYDYEAVSEALITEKPEITTIFINGERNRILYEGEENFLDENNTDLIDLESTFESGKIVLQKSEFTESGSNDNTPVSEDLNIETIINENEINDDKAQEIIHSDAELSFQKVEAFSPETEAVANEDKTENEAVSEDLNIETIINENEINDDKAQEIIHNNAELSFQKVEAFSPETQAVANEDKHENEAVSEDLNIETIINENEINDDKAQEIIHNDAELSFQKVEAFSAEPEAVANEDKPENEAVSEDLNIETNINEDKINDENTEQTVQESAEVSFHGTESFLPEITIESTNSHAEATSETPKASANKHEDEMRRLIEQVEKKMKEQKADEIIKTESEEEKGTEISFAETQEFVIEQEKTVEDQQISATEPVSDEQPAVQTISAWKPMSLESHAPDSFSRKVEFKETEVFEDPQNAEPEAKVELNEAAQTSPKEIVSEEKSVNEELISENDQIQTEEEARVMNVSFFGADISSLSIQTKAKSEEEKKAEEASQNDVQQTILDSNVPGFINTWQSWLKIDRTEEVEKAKAEIKTKAIDSFIENNPKISQLKDEVSFVVKEKTDDISHLMTETLANIYAEQKLYTKAINAFQILAAKHPERKEYFENKIQEIKDQRGKN